MLKGVLNPSCHNNPLAPCSVINLHLLLLHSWHLDEIIIFPFLVSETSGFLISIFFLHFKQNEIHCLIVSKFFIQWFRVLVDCLLYWFSLSTWENFVPHLISRTNYSKLTSESISALDFIWSILINSFLNNKAIFLYLFLSNFFSDKKH